MGILEFWGVWASGTKLVLKRRLWSNEETQVLVIAIYCLGKWKQKHEANGERKTETCCHIRNLRRALRKRNMFHVSNLKISLGSGRLCLGTGFLQQARLVNLAIGSEWQRGKSNDPTTWKWPLQRDVSRKSEKETNQQEAKLQEKCQNFNNFKIFQTSKFRLEFHANVSITTRPSFLWCGLAVLWPAWHHVLRKGLLKLLQHSSKMATQITDSVGLR